MTGSAIAGDEHGHSRELDFSKAPRGAVLWGHLAKARVQRRGGKFVVDFLPPVQALEGKRMTLYGFMTPIDQIARHSRFLLSMQPFLCNGCSVPPAPEGIVEIHVRRPEPAQDEPLAVRGTFSLVRDHPHGLIYRLDDAHVVMRTKKIRQGLPAQSKAAR